MAICELCQRPTAPKDPYCASCGHERIVESLQAPTRWPSWFDQALRTATVVVGIWLLFTVGVAFLREAKALRRARAALATHNPGFANTWVSPFLETHPNHPEALYLAGQASIHLASQAGSESRQPGNPDNHLSEATARYKRLSQMTDNDDAAERTEKLKEIYQQRIPLIASALECGQSSFAEFYDSLEGLGTEFQDTLLRSGAIVAVNCADSNNPRVANEPGYWLIHEKNFDPESIATTLYLEQVPAALDGGNYQLAHQLAIQGLTLWPAGEPQFLERLSKVREQVAKTVKEISDLCVGIGRDPKFRQENVNCFPRSLQATLNNRPDAWGNALVYSPSSPDREGRCFRNFALTSWGADGKQSPGDSSTPAAEITCRHEWGRPRYNFPDRLWWAEQ